MGRYTGPKCRLCRREGEKLFLKGAKCYSDKCPVTKRRFPPGTQQSRRRRRMSQYGLRLREKQKVRRIYGIRERQFRQYVETAQKFQGVTGDMLLRLLERRLDNSLYRGGLASSRDQARQLVNHGHVWVNGRRVDIPSFLVKPGDAIEFKENSQGKKGIKAIMEENNKSDVPEWLERTNGQLRVLEQPITDEIQQDLEMNLIVEYYSR